MEVGSRRRGGGEMPVSLSPLRPVSRACLRTGKVYVVVPRIQAVLEESGHSGHSKLLKKVDTLEESGHS